ncbi:MAG: hypothetical protein JSS75_07480 [Bacteroidetes bacterium]|nr:hypothetical protein [Bacteroidota bacterium]
MPRTKYDARFYEELFDTPPLVYERGGRFYLQWWDPTKRENRRKSLKVKVDIPVPEKPSEPRDWWHKSAHKQYITAEIRKVLQGRRTEQALSIVSPAVAAIPRFRHNPAMPIAQAMEKMNADAQANGSLSKQTLRRREHTIVQVTAFDPRATIQGMNREWFGKFRPWMEAQGFSEWTRWTILSDLKRLFVRMKVLKVIDSTPFDGDNPVKFSQPETFTSYTPLSEEFAFFRHAYYKRPDIFLVLITERLAGWRWSDIYAMKRSELDLKEKIFRESRNQKARRVDTFPMSDCLHALYVDLYKKLGHDFAFAHLEYATIRKYIVESCDALGIPRLRTHQFKKTYNGEILPLARTEQSYKRLIHHKVTDTGGKHYSKNEVELLRSILNEAQKPWSEFVQELTRHKGAQ